MEAHHETCKRWIGLAMNMPGYATETAARMGMQDAWLGVETARAAWNVIRTMHSSGKPIDTVFVVNEAKERGVRSVSKEYLEDALANCPNVGKAADGLVSMLRKEYVRREMSNMAANMVGECDDPIEKAARMARDLLDLATSHAGDKGKEEIIQEIIDDWKHAASGRMRGLPMPWAKMYAMSGGVEPGEGCLVVAHGGTGKSTLVLQWAKWAAENGWPSLVFPFEDGVNVALKRLAGFQSSVNPLLLKLGRSTPDELNRAIEGLRVVTGIPLYLSAMRGTISDIAVTVGQYVARFGVKAVFIDAMKDVARSTGGNEGDNEVINGACGIAKRLRIPVIVCHHVRKPPTSIKENPWASWNITPSDLKGSGDYWDAPRVVMALQKYPKDATATEFKHQLHLMKCNNGIAGVRVDVEQDHVTRWVESVNPTGEYVSEPGE